MKKLLPLRGSLEETTTKYPEHSGWVSNLRQGVQSTTCVGGFAAIGEHHV